MIKNYEELIERVKKGNVKKTAAVVCAHDEHTLEAVDMAVKNNIIIPILIGEGKRIKEIVEARGFALKDAEIREEKEDKEAAKMSIKMVRSGEADFIMKGNLQTADLMREVVNKETGLNMGCLMSHFVFMEIPGYHKLIVVTDGGLIPHPNLDEKAQILINAVNVLHNMGYENPKVAVLAAAETVSPKIQETVDADLLKKMNQEGKITGCIVEGPISFDLMISHESARIKNYKSPITGDADIMIMPDIAAGNICAKALVFFSGAKAAGTIIGAKVPIAMISRGASAEEKYLSIVLTAAAARKQV